MQRTTVALALRWLWVVLMAVLLVLLVTNSIGGIAMVLYGCVVLVGAIADMALSGRLTE